jgi:serine/threonine protein phosphatase PrpC
MLQVDFAQISHPGLVRDTNEDYLGCFVPQTREEARLRGWLFALADGVGGQDRGEVASRISVETLVAGFRSAAPGEPLITLLPRLVQSANLNVFETALHTLGGSSMATTLVACALRFDRAAIAHAGDSRCYLIRKGCAVQLTRDHTVSNEQLRMGILTTREAASAATAHLLSRSLGAAMFLNVEVSEHQIFAGDLLLLCSDGLHRSVSAEELARIVRQAGNLSSACEQLVALANQRDGSDNISLQLIRIQSVERVGMYRGRHYKIQ